MWGQCHSLNDKRKVIFMMCIDNQSFMNRREIIHAYFASPIA